MQEVVYISNINYSDIYLQRLPSELLKMIDNTLEHMVKDINFRLLIEDLQRIVNNEHNAVFFIPNILIYSKK